MDETIIVLGVILSMIFYEITEMSPGGMIVPGYFALFFNEPKKIILTVLISIILFFMVKILENYIVIFGRRKFMIYIILTFIVKKIFGYLDLEILLGSTIIGILIPAILAHDFDKNGVEKVLISLIILSITMKSIIMLVDGII